MLSKLFLHLLEPEFHGVVDDLDRTTLDNRRCDRRVAKVLACLDDALIVESDGAGVDEASLDQGLTELPRRLKLCLSRFATCLAIAGS